ncbi:MAG: VPLPA-CTERM sorting domain-containing protein [Pseudomonadota bacterium]
MFHRTMLAAAAAAVATGAQASTVYIYDVDRIVQDDQFSFLEDGILLGPFATVQGFIETDGLGLIEAGSVSPEIIDWDLTIELFNVGITIASATVPRDDLGGGDMGFLPVASYTLTPDNSDFELFSGATVEATEDELIYGQPDDFTEAFISFTDPGDPFVGWGLSQGSVTEFVDVLGGPSDFFAFQTVSDGNEEPFAERRLAPPPPSGEVPLPAAGWLLLAGLGGLAAAKGRRRAA